MRFRVENKNGKKQKKQKKTIKNKKKINFFAFLVYFNFCSKIGGEKKKGKIESKHKITVGKKRKQVRKNEGTSKIIRKKPGNRILLQQVQDFPPT